MSLQSNYTEQYAGIKGKPIRGTNRTNPESGQPNCTPNQVGKEAVTELELRLEITDKGNFDEYLGMKVKKQSNNNYKLSPLLLIEQILKAMDFNEQTKPQRLGKADT